jgi:CHAT domain-containing protein/tetratricopeptide (TPR) repeat protein
MNQPPCSPDLVEAFYRAYNDTTESQQGRLAACESILAALSACTVTDASYEPWRLLFAGILANEREHDWGEGERLFQAALAANRSHAPLLEARAWLALGVTYHHLDRWQDSMVSCQRALKALTGLDKPLDVASAWINMAISCGTGYAHGAFAASALREGTDYCQQAVAALAELPPGRERNSMEASLYNALGTLHSQAGQWREALAAFQRHFSICQEAGYLSRTGISLNNQGEVYERLGPDYVGQATEAHQAALAIHRQHGNIYLEFQSLLYLASLSQTVGDAPQALAHYGAAIERAQAIRLGVSTAEARAGFFATVANAYAFAVLLAVELGRVALAFDLIESSRSRAFLDQLAAGTADLPRRQEAPTLTLDAVRAALPADVALLEYFTCGLVEADDDGRSQGAAVETGVRRLPPPTTLLFVVTAAEVAVHDLGLSPNDLLPRQRRAITERHFLKPGIRRALYDRLVGPAAAQTAGKRRLYLVPHGPLHLVPFQALMAPDGETLLRADGPELIYGPSATALFGRPQRAREHPPSDASLICLALGFNGSDAQRLHFAEDEARSIATLLGGDALAGPASKREALFGRGMNARFLHISCHGEFDPAAPLQSRLHLGAAETLTAHDVLQGLQLQCDLVTLSACESGLSRVRRGDELMGLVRAFTLAGAQAVIATLWRVDERSTRVLMEKFYREVTAGASFAQALQQAQIFLRTLRRETAVQLLAASPTEEKNALTIGEAASYLKGLAADPAPAALRGSVEFPFADPFYWAPFIVIGDDPARPTV